MHPFLVSDCALLTKTSGLEPAMNLRELRDRVAQCSDAVLYHHFCETPLVPLFDNPDYRNDFAVWAKQYLGDHILAEQLGIIDPYTFSAIRELRAFLLDLFEERLAEVDYYPTVEQGSEFYFMEAITVVFSTGDSVGRPEDLAAAVGKMTSSSVYYHFLEARRREPAGMDDFSTWLLECGDEWRSLGDTLAGIDFYFYNLSDLKQVIAQTLTESGQWK